MSELAPAHVLAPRRRPLAFELAFVTLVSLIVLVPGIWGYSLVDPWETHYGEVAREMLQNDDWVHTEWRGTMDGNPNDNEGFRSKPVLQFWLMATSLKTLGVAAHGGYSGELTESPMTMVAIRLPFILCAIAGLTLMWWMLARLVNRRLAWLALLVVGTSPMFCMIARNAIPDMPLVACTMGALALFTMAMEDGEREIHPLGYLRVIARRGLGSIVLGVVLVAIGVAITVATSGAPYLGGRFLVGYGPVIAGALAIGRGIWMLPGGRWERTRLALDARHVVLGLAGLFVFAQAAYYAVYFVLSPQLAVRGAVPSPAFTLPLIMLLAFGVMSTDGWMIARLPLVLIGGVIAALVNEPMPQRQPGQTLTRHILDNILTPWDRHAPDRYLLRIPIYLLLSLTDRTRSAWRDSLAPSGLRKLTTMRQLYLLGCYFLLGVSILAKGPPGLAVVGAVGAFYVLLLGKWRALATGAFELKRGLAMMFVVAIPWHLAMFYKDGIRFIDEYLFVHILNRAAVGVDNSPGSFEMYTSQIGHGMWLWAALLPAAVAATFLRARMDSREGRVRFLVGLWAISAVAVFCLVQTKFHHYILPALPPLGLLVAFMLDDIAAKRDRLHPIWALLGIGMVLFMCRDLMFEPERWIEMFVYRYDRPWPATEPWNVDPSDGFLALGVAGAAAIALLATRFARAGVIAVGAVGLAICVFALQAYMPVAGTHWGMREAIRTYYAQRTVYGQKLVYFGASELADDWRSVKDTWSFDTMLPDAMQVGQPMTITVQLNKADDERVTEQEVTLVGTATKLGKHTVTVTLAPGERAKLDPLVARGAKGGKRGKRPWRTVDADRLIGWQLYWRGENFWSGDEIWAYLPEQKTQFNKTDNVELLKYLNDRTRAPLGRRYFIVTEAGRINSAKSLVPTPRGRDTFEVLDTTSNKFSLAGFTL